MTGHGNDENPALGRWKFLPVRCEMTALVEDFACYLDLQPNLGAHNLTRAPVRDTEHDFSTALISQSAGILGESIEVILGLPLLKFALLAFDAVEDPLETGGNGVHFKRPSFMSRPTSFSSAANAASALCLSCFIASSTDRVCWSVLGST